METSTELTNALNRIKELEQIHDLEQEENIRLVEVIEDLEGKLKHNAEGWQNAVAEKDKYKDRVKELEAEVINNQSIFTQLEQALMWKDDFEKEATIMKLIHKGAALQSPSSAKDTPVQVVSVIKRTVEDGYMVRRGEPFHYTLVAYCHNLHEANEIADLLKSSPVSVDINQELVEALEEIIHMQIDENRLYWTIDDMRLKAAAALSKASPPKQNEK
jgi:hypothetical protein